MLVLAVSGERNPAQSEAPGGEALQHLLHPGGALLHRRRLLPLSLPRIYLRFLPLQRPGLLDHERLQLQRLEEMRSS